MPSDATHSPRLRIWAARLHPLWKSLPIQDISCSALREQHRASITPNKGIKIKSSSLNSRHKQAPAKESHSVPFLPPPLEQTPLTSSYARGICAHREALKTLGGFQAFFSFPPPEAKRSVSAKVLSALLSGHFEQTNRSVCPPTFLMPLGKGAKALAKCLYKAKKKRGEEGWVLCSHEITASSVSSSGSQILTQHREVLPAQRQQFRRPTTLSKKHDIKTNHRPPPRHGKMYSLAFRPSVPVA